VLAGAIYPTVARRAGEGRLAVRHVLTIGAVSCALGVVLAIVLYAVREPAVRLVFGARYAFATELLGVLVWALPGECGAMGLGVVAAARRRQSWSLWWQLVVLVGAIVSMALVIPRSGPVGLAWVVVAVQSAAVLGAFAVALLAVLVPVSSAGEAGPTVESTV
jgi:O-antigen/teichoic acid export membrane protein